MTPFPETTFRCPRRERGFALLTVLFGLAILSGLIVAALFWAAAHQKSAARLSWEQEAAGVLDKTLAIAERIARRSLIAGNEVLPPPDGLPYAKLEVIDAAGLIDVNAARPDLTAHLLGALGFDELVLKTDLQARRRAGARFRSPDEFADFIGASDKQTALLVTMTTTRSGKRGVSPDHAPKRLLDILADETGEIRPEWSAPPTRRVFEVFARRRKDGPVSLRAALRLGGAATGSATVLALDVR